MTINILRKLFCALSILLFIILCGCVWDIPEVRPSGPVYYIYGKVLNSTTDSPVANAVISDGFSSTITNNRGEYRFKSFPGASYVFISVPELYEIPMKDGMPRIFEPLDSSQDSIQINFSLTPLKNGIEKEFTLFAVADPQVSQKTNVNRFKNETIPDLIKEREEHDIIYGVTLGDLISNPPEFFSDIKESFSSIDIPFFHTIGNHDFTNNIYEPIEASKDYQSYFGPLDYSFNRGNTHIIVMNNVFNFGVTSYNWGFSEEQISWLKADLQYVPKEKMVIVCVHIPVLRNTTIERKSMFLQTLSPYHEVHILSGHSHENRNIIHPELNVYEHVTGAASGLWWSGIVNKCGTPNGYGVYEISGNTMKNWYYKPVNFDKNHQIRMLLPHTFGDTEGYVIANVWNADKNWKIELLEDEVNKGEMEQFTDYAPEIYALNKSRNVSESSDSYRKTDHLYRRKPDNPNATFSIKATDQFGNTYYQTTAASSINVLTKY